MDLVGQFGQPKLEALEGEVGADGGVAAGDVEVVASHRHHLVVGRHSADRHDVAEVAVGHQGGALGAAGDVLELRPGVVVVSENGGLGHAVLKPKEKKRGRRWRPFQGFWLCPSRG